MTTALLAQPKLRLNCVVNSVESEPENPFGQWLKGVMDDLKIKQPALAKRSGLAQSTISSYLGGTRTPQTRAHMAQLVKGLLPEDADEDAFESLFSQGLHAKVGLEDDVDEHEVIDFLRGQPPAKQDRAMRMLKAAFEEEDAVDNAGNIGKKPE